jgi:hypothetical protein
MPSIGWFNARAVCHTVGRWCRSYKESRMVFCRLLLFETIPVLDFLNNLWGLGSRKRVGIRLSYRLARLCRLAQSIPGLYKSLKIRALHGASLSHTVTALAVAYT